MYIGDYFKNIGVGSGANRLKIEADGTIKREGDATVWDDLVTSLIGSRLYSTAGKVNYNYAENAVEFQPGGSISTEADVINFNFQHPHAAVVNGSLKLHIHWEQPNSTDREFTVRYRIQKNGQEKTTAWTTVVVAANATNNVFAYVSGTLNQITPLASIDMTDAGISATVQVQMARTDSETGNILGTFLDAHVEYDTDGSRSEYSK